MTIGELITDLLKTTDLSNQEIVERVKSQFPDAKTTAKSVASVASVARKYGVNIAKRPTVKPTEELEALRRELAYTQRQLKVALYLNDRMNRKVAA
jgi:hypothetical protein